MAIAPFGSSTSQMPRGLPNDLLPGLFDPIRSLAHQPDLLRDSWFLIGYVENKQGSRFNVLVHQIINSRPGDPLEIASILNVTDITNKTYRGEELIYGADEVTLDTNVMLNVTPSSTLSGDTQRIHAVADFGWSRLDFDVSFPGQIMLNGGIGVFNFLGGPTAQYSIPWGQGGGTFVLDGVEHEVSGTFWFDRQWGFPQDLYGDEARAPYALRNETGDAAPEDRTPTQDKWCWMDLNLSNGIVLGLWEIELGEQHFGWVTALKPDGTHIIAALEPLAEGSGDVWVSPSSGQRYPTRFTVKVPGLGCTLDVKSLLDEQEIPSGAEPKYEGVAEISGVYEDKPVTGFTLIELMGNWRN
jgi:predicted secreted hydrolase